MLKLSGTHHKIVAIVMWLLILTTNNLLSTSERTCLFVVQFLSKGKLSVAIVCLLTAYNGSCAIDGLLLLRGVSVEVVSGGDHIWMMLEPIILSFISCR